MRLTSEIKQFILITTISTFLMIGGYFIAPIEARFLFTLTENPVLVGLTFSLGTIAYALLSFIAGRLSVSYGKRRMITIGVILCIVYPIIYATSINIFQYMGGRLVWAFAGGATGPLLGALLQDTVSKNKSKGKLIGTFHSIHAGAGSIGAFLGGYISESYSLVTPYYVMAFFFIIPAILSIAFIGFRDRDHEKTAKKRSLDFSIRYILKNNSLKGSLTLDTAFSLNWSVKALLYPLAIYSITQSDLITGSIFATMGIVAIFALPLAGSYVDKKGYRKGLYIAYAILGISTFFLAFSNSLTLFWFFAALLAVGEAWHGSAKGVLEVENIENKYRGEIFGFSWAYSSLIGAISTLFAGFMLLYLDIFTVLLFYSIFFWIALALGSVFLRRENKN
ncbi:MAG: MFS transporter [archaeon]|nr:MFS transporter [archaeon]